MKTSTTSTQAMSTSLRLQVAKMQANLAKAQTELASSRKADVGLAIGGRTGQSVALRQENTRLQSITDTNSIVSGRLSATQQGLTSIQSTAKAFLQALVTARAAGTSAATSIVTQAGGNLQSLTDSLNANVNGQYIFSGLNTDVKPVAAYAAGSANKTAVDTAFQTAFGVTQNAAGVADITSADMQSFLDTTFAGQFSGTQWTANWSSASSQTIRSRISTSEVVDTSVSANNPALQKLTRAYTMVSQLGLQTMSQATFQTVMDAAAKDVGEALKGLTDIQAGMGIAQNRVADANQRMSIQMSVLSTQVDGLEGVDPYEAQTRMSALTTQIQTAYALTSQLQQLSLLKYL